MNVIVFLKKAIAVAEICQRKGVLFKLSYPYSGNPERVKFEVVSDPVLMKTFIIYSDQCTDGNIEEKLSHVVNFLEGGKSANEDKSL